MPSSGMVCSETRETPASPSLASAASGSHLFHKARSLLRGRAAAATPSIPSASAQNLPQTRITPKPSALVPLRNPRGSHHSRQPRAATYFPIPRLQLPTQRWPRDSQRARPSARDSAPKIPAVKMQESEEGLADHGTWYSCRARRGRRESLPGLTERPRSAGSFSSARWLRREPAARAAAGEARRAPRGSVSCSSSRARRASAPSQPPEPGAASRRRDSRRQTPFSHPGPAAMTRPPPGLSSPGARVPRVPAQGGLCWTVRARDPEY